MPGVFYIYAFVYIAFQLFILIKNIRSDHKEISLLEGKDYDKMNAMMEESNYDVKTYVQKNEATIKSVVWDAVKGGLFPLLICVLNFIWILVGVFCHETILFIIILATDQFSNSFYSKRLVQDGKFGPDAKFNIINSVVKIAIATFVLTKYFINFHN